MKTIFEHIEYAKGQPHHIREKLAFGIAAGTSGLIALVWLVGSFSSNSFAIQGSTFADSTGQGSAAVATSGNTNSSDSGLAGAAAALPGAGAPARIEVIDTSAPTTTRDTSEQTTIPF